MVNSAVYQSQKNSQYLQPKEDESNINEFTLISVINTRTHSDIDDDDTEQMISDSNNEVDANNEEASDDGFDACISAMEMEDMSKAAKEILPRAAAS